MVLTLRDLLPYIQSRMTTQGLVYTEDGETIVVREHAGAIGESVSWLCMLPFHFGVYEWKCRLERLHAGVDIFPGLLERHHGWMGEGGIFLQANGIANHFLSNGGATPTALAGQDWTVERSLKIDWKPSYVHLYVDGNIVGGLNQANTPQETLNLFAEISINAGVTTTAPTRVTIRDIRVPEPTGYA